MHLQIGVIDQTPATSLHIQTERQFEVDLCSIAAQTFIEPLAADGGNAPAHIHALQVIYIPCFATPAVMVPYQSTERENAPYNLSGRGKDLAVLMNQIAAAQAAQIGSLFKVRFDAFQPVIESVGVIIRDRNDIPGYTIESDIQSLHHSGDANETDFHGQLFHPACNNCLGSIVFPTEDDNNLIRQSTLASESTQATLKIRWPIVAGDDNG